MIVRIHISGGRTHLAELQLQLKVFSEARKSAHKHYKTLREAFPRMFEAKQAEAGQVIIMDVLTTR